MDQQRKHRRSIRIPHFDYSQPGYYFVTVCTEDRKEYFGNVESGVMCLSEIGAVAERCLRDIPNHFDNVELDEIVVMPNHVHMVTAIVSRVGAQHIVPLPDQRNTFQHVVPGSLGSIIRGFKIGVTKWSRENGKPFGWQPNYYEHIIRNERSLERIREYITHNPLKWELDVENPKCVNLDKRYYEEIFGAV